MKAIHPVTTTGATIGAQTPHDYGALFGPKDLHSQALLATFVQSAAFKEMTGRLPWLLGMIFDSDLFAYTTAKTNTTDPNLLEHLIRHQVGLRDPATGASPWRPTPCSTASPPTWTGLSWRAGLPRESAPATRRRRSEAADDSSWKWPASRPANGHRIATCHEWLP